MVAGFEPSEPAGQKPPAEVLRRSSFQELEDDGVEGFEAHVDRMNATGAPPRDASVSSSRDQASTWCVRETATASSLELTPSAWSRWRTWLRTVSGLRCSSAAICLVEWPRSSWRRT